MMHMMTMVPPIQRNMMTTGDAAFWVMIGLLVVLAVVVTVFWIVGSRRIAQQSSEPQVRDAGHEYETLPPVHFVGKEQSPVPSRHEEEVLLRR